MMLLDFPLIISSFWSLSAFYVIAQRELHPKTWKRSILLLPMLMAVGVGLTLINTRAVMEALFGVKSGFVRTPKYAIEGTQAARLAVKKYKRKSGWLPYFELACGTYFLYMCWFAISTWSTEVRRRRGLCIGPARDITLQPIAHRGPATQRIDFMHG